MHPGRNPVHPGCNPVYPRLQAYVSQARVYSLRAFLLILIRRMRPQPRSMEPAEVGFFRRLAARYQGLEHLFQVSKYEVSK